MAGEGWLVGGAAAGEVAGGRVVEGGGGALGSRVTWVRGELHGRRR